MKGHNYKYHISLMYWAISKTFACSSSDEPDNVFLTRPKVIQFTQYAVGIVYEVRFFCNFLWDQRNSTRSKLHHCLCLKIAIPTCLDVHLHTSIAHMFDYCLDMPICMHTCAAMHNCMHACAHACIDSHTHISYPWF